MADSQESMKLPNDNGAMGFFRSILRGLLLLRSLGENAVAVYLFIAKLGVSLEMPPLKDYKCSKECSFSVDPNGSDLTALVGVCGKVVKTYDIRLTDVMESRIPWSSPTATKIEVAADDPRKVGLEIEILQGGNSIRKLTLPELLPTEETATADPSDVD